MNRKPRLLSFSVLLSTGLLGFSGTCASAAPIELKPESQVVLMGNGLASRMVHFGHFETELHLRFPNHKLTIRNMADEGNTPSLRPHSGRGYQLGFPGAEQFHAPYTGGNTADAKGHFETEEQWMTRLKPDVLLAFFGFNESFQGKAGLENFQAELDAFVKHTKAQAYNGTAPAELVLVSPIAYEDISDILDVPNGKAENRRLSMYAAVIEAVALQNGVRYVDLFTASKEWYSASDSPLTSDGALLNSAGYAKLAPYLVSQVFGGTVKTLGQREAVLEAVNEKNWFWITDFKMPNGVHVFGRRYNPFGPQNYPFEIEKVRAMTVNRDLAIWNTLAGKPTDLVKLDAATPQLPPVPTNYKPSAKNGGLTFLKGDEALSKLTVPNGYKIEQWATEQEFPNLANPVQMSFDNQGRLWVATMPSYPHYLPGDPRPDDKLIILEDTNNDGKADKETVFADKLHLPMGFEIAPEGVYVSQGINLVLLKDTDNDGKADEKEVLYSGFDDHDTHHAIGAYCADPSGAMILCEGIFLRSNIETPYGPVRGTDGGFFRYAPQRRHLERHAQLSIPNPWGVAFDAWGQHFFLHTSGPTTEWMLPGTIKPEYGRANPKSENLIESAHRVRPTSGIEFLHSRHFPEEVQGDMLLCNAIGFLGTKQHKVSENGTGYSTKWRQDLVKSSDGNFRPVDLEIAPDGSLFIVDWHNPLIGHMQHNARDPNRDHSHGRVYRVTYPGRPLVKPAKVAGASIGELLENLKLPEYRTRYRTRRELRGRDADEVVAAVSKWAKGLDKRDPNYLHHLTEGLWVTWGANKVDQELLRFLLTCSDHRARAAAVRVVRYTGHQVKDQTALLTKAAQDEHGRVRLEAITAASWLKKSDGLAVFEAANTEPGAAKDASQEQPVKVAGNGEMIRILHPAGQSGRVSSVKMTLPGGERTINLSEIQILAGKKDITGDVRFSSSSVMGQYVLKNLVDGDKKNFFHTEVEANPWLQITFSKPVAFSEIKIWNRSGFTDRFANAQVEYFQGTKKVAQTKVALAGGGGSGPMLADPWTKGPYSTALARLNNETVVDELHKVVAPKHLKKGDAELFVKGAEIYEREGFCGTCHQPDGEGLVSAGFPPLAGSRWVTEQDERLIKLTMKGLMGPIEVKGKTYPGLVPMTPFEGMLNDEEMAAVLTYVRNSFGNKAAPISADQVKAVRASDKNKQGFYSPEELLKAHPHR